jgi:hypothetical protein
MRKMLGVLIVVFLSLASRAQPAFSGVYHEASCPSVDATRMKRMTRTTAEAVGLIPAFDCHPGVRVRYLGICCPASSDTSNAERRVEVDEYTKKDGTHVNGYTRSMPHSAPNH